MPKTITPYLMFNNGAEHAAKFYCDLFDGAQIVQSEYWQEGEPGQAGQFKMGRLRLLKQEVIIFNSPITHEFDFTPSFSFFVECRDESELDKLFSSLSEEGQIMMPPDNYGFSKKFTWISDRWGVSWQLNLTEKGEIS